MASGPVRMRTSRSLLPPSWASSQKTFRTCVPTSVLSVSTWVSEGLPASGHPGRTPALSPDPASPAALPVSAVPATLPPHPGLLRLETWGRPGVFPFPFTSHPIPQQILLAPPSDYFQNLLTSHPFGSRHHSPGLDYPSSSLMVSVVSPVPLSCYSLSPPPQPRGPGVLMNPRQSPSCGVL